MLENFHFLRPLWLLAFIPAAVLGWLVWNAGSSMRVWRRLVDDHLLSHLLTTQKNQSRMNPRPLLFAAWFLAIIALAGPSWSLEPSPFADDMASLVIVVDCSTDMLARDVQPSRQERAGQKIGELVSQRADSRNGLIAYAGSAHLVLPLTKDAEVIRSFASELSPEIMPSDGHAAHRAVELANTILRESLQAGSILLVTGGLTEEEQKSLVEMSKSGGAPVHILGVGAMADAPIAVSGPPALPLDEDALQRTARQCGGRFVAVTPDNRDIVKLIGNVQTNYAAAVIPDGGERWRDNGYWLVPALCLIGIMWMRPGWSVRWEE